MSIAEKILRAKTDYDEVYEAGKFAERSNMWGKLTNYGQPKDYSKNNNSIGYFSSSYTDNTFKPVYNITPTDANVLFQGCAVTDLETKLNECGVTLDMSQCKGAYRCFHSSSITVIPELDMRNCTNFFQAFNSSKIVTIRKLILGNTLVSRNWNTPFYTAKALKNIEIEGTIFHDTTIPSTVLTKASIISVINALSSETTDTTLTLLLSAVNNAFETSEGVADGSTSDKWKNLIATKPNWTVALI